MDKKRLAHKEIPGHHPRRVFPAVVACARLMPPTRIRAQWAVITADKKLVFLQLKRISRPCAKDFAVRIIPIVHKIMNVSVKPYMPQTYVAVA